MSRQFGVTLEFSSTGHRPIFNLVSDDCMDRFRVPYGSGAYTHIASCVVGSNWAGAWNEAVREPGTFQPLGEIELNDVDHPYLRQFLGVP